MFCVCQILLFTFFIFFCILLLKIKGGDKVDNNFVGRRINKIRLSLGETMAVFGERFGTSKGTVNNWEKGRNMPNKENLKAIADLGHITVEELLSTERKNYYEEIEDIVNECLAESVQSIDKDFKEDILNATLARFLSSNLRDKDKIKRFVSRIIEGEYPYMYYILSIYGQNFDLENIHYKNTIKALTSFKYMVFSPHEFLSVLMMNQLEVTTINDGLSLYNFYLDKYDTLKKDYSIEKSKDEIDIDVLNEIKEKIDSTKYRLERMKKYLDI